MLPLFEWCMPTLIQYHEADLKLGQVKMLPFSQPEQLGFGFFLSKSKSSRGPISRLIQQRLVKQTASQQSFQSLCLGNSEPREYEGQI